MYLTFQVPLQYCSLHHWNLLSSPYTSTTEHYFCSALHSIVSGAVSNCSLLFPGGILTTFWPGGSHLPGSYLFAFSYCSCSCSFHGKNTGIICHSLLQKTTFCQLQLSYSWVTNFKLKSSQINSFPLRRLWRSPISQISVAPWPSIVSLVLSFLFSFPNSVIYLFLLCYNHGYVFCNPPKCWSIVFYTDLLSLPSMVHFKSVWTWV